MNRELNEFLCMLNDLEEGVIIEVLERNTQETACGTVDRVYQWVINMSNSFEKTEFVLI